MASIKWMHVKRDIIRGLLYAKFSQNSELRSYLCSTNGKNLIDGCVDDFWGLEVPLHSRELKEGNWHGRIELGRLLVSVREQLLHEQDAVLM